MFELFEESLVVKIIAATEKRVSMRDGSHVLILDGEMYDLTLDQADVLFRTMFFRVPA